MGPTAMCTQMGPVSLSRKGDRTMEMPIYERFDGTQIATARVGGIAVNDTGEACNFGQDANCNKDG